jgi:acyl carrier protein
MSGAEERIRNFLVEEAGWQGPRENLTDDLPLIENHVLDSMGLLRMVAGLESEFGIAIGDADVVPSNFGSIERINRFVEGKLAETASR